MANSARRPELDPILYDELDYLLKQATINPQLPPPFVPSELTQAIAPPIGFRRSPPPDRLPSPEPPSPVGNIRIDWDSYAARRKNDEPPSDHGGETEQPLRHHLDEVVSRYGPPLRTGVKKVTDNLAKTFREYGAHDIADNLGSLIDKAADYTPVDDRGTLGMNDLGDALLEELTSAGLSLATTPVPLVALANGYTQTYGPLKDERRKNNNGEWSGWDEGAVQLLSAGNALLESSGVGPTYRLARPLVGRGAVLANSALRKLAAEPFVRKGLDIAERSAERAIKPVRDVVAPVIAEGVETVGEAARKAIVEPARKTVDNVLQSETYRAIDDRIGRPARQVLDQALDSTPGRRATEIGRETGKGAAEGAGRSIAQKLGETVGTPQEADVDPLKTGVQGLSGAFGQIGNRVGAPLRALMLPSLMLGADAVSPPASDATDPTDDLTKTMAKRALLLRNGENAVPAGTQPYAGRGGGRSLAAPN